jgi:hypothetical protein
MRVRARVVNAGIATLTVILTATGVFAFAAGSEEPAAILTAVHGASGLGLLLLAPWKIAVARRGLRRPGRWRKVIGIGLAVTVLIAVAGGVWHAIAGFRPYAGVLPMQLHVGAGLVALALVVAHLTRHPPRLRRTDLDRRTALRAAGLAVGAAALWLVAPGRERRVTGSHEVGSGDPGRCRSRSGCSTPCRGSTPWPGGCG